MSRWWPERLVIGLAPDRVDLLRLSRWPSRRPIDQRRLDCTPVTGEPPWSAALKGLDTALPPAAGAAVTVVLSNHFLRYLVLPWQPAITRSSELETLARLRFEQIHGAVVADWTVQLCDGGYGAPLLACAVDTGLVAGLRVQLERRGLRLASVQGLLMAAFNHHRRHLTQAASAATADNPAALALIEPGRLCLALLAGGEWLSVCTRRIGADASGVIEQELAALQVTPGSLDVLLVGDASVANRDIRCPVRMLGTPAFVNAPDPAALAEPSRRDTSEASLAATVASPLAPSLAHWGAA